MSYTDEIPVDAYRVGMTYVPMQKYVNLYDDDTAFSRGTLFQELDLPFEGKGATAV